jgi:chromate transporter
MMGPLLKRRDPVAISFLIAVFVAIGLLRLPLPPVLLIAIPLSIAITYAMRRNVAS